MSLLAQALGNQKPRKKNDFYPTIDARAIPPLLAQLPPGTVYAEPCAGSGDLMRLLADAGLQCSWGLEMEPQGDFPQNIWPVGRGNALTLGEADVADATCFITNPPWTRDVLHQLIWHLSALRPTWLLFDASWCFTKQARKFERICTDVVSVGRLKWFPPPGRLLRNPEESEAAYSERCKKNRSHDPPDDCAWYRFDARAPYPTRFHFPVSASPPSGVLL